jgi:D-sedoheptulose 7-phosphate isomerase
MRGIVVPRRSLAQLVAERERVLGAFLESGQDAIARACHDVARCLRRGGILLPCGVGAAEADAMQVALYFMRPLSDGGHPALAALPPTSDLPPAARLARLARASDVALAIAHGPAEPELHEFLGAAGERGLLRLALLGPGGAVPEADHVLVVDSDDPQIVREVQRLAHHLLREQVQFFLAHPELLDDACLTGGDSAVQGTVVAVSASGAQIERDGLREEVAANLVPGVSVGDVLLCHAGVALERLPAMHAPATARARAGAPRRLDSVLAGVRASTAHQGSGLMALRRRLDLARIEACGTAIRARLDAGGRLLAFGSGASATDTRTTVADALQRGWPAVALSDGAAFARQITAFGTRGDVALAISTSGASPSIVTALSEARTHGMLTCAIAGHDGGRLAGLAWLDHLLLVPGTDAPGVQQVQTTAAHLLLEAVGRRS